MHSHMNLCMYTLTINMNSIQIWVSRDWSHRLLELESNSGRISNLYTHSFLEQLSTGPLPSSSSNNSEVYLHTFHVTIFPTAHAPTDPPTNIKKRERVPKIKDQGSSSSSIYALIWTYVLLFDVFLKSEEDLHVNSKGT